MDSLINDCYRQLTSERNWYFLQKTATATTVASQQFFVLPYDYEELVNVTVTISNYLYTPKEAPSRIFWDVLNQSTQYTSNYPEWYFIFNGQIGFWPTPSSTGSTITYSYKRKVVDLNFADYTTGNVSAVTNGATAVTGSGTSWNDSMNGKYLVITPSSTAATNGDGFPYEISDTSSTTALTLSKAYQGTTISSNATYTIMQVPVLPEPYQMLPVYRAVSMYFASVQPESVQSRMYDELYEKLHLQLIRDDSTKSENVMIQMSDRFPQNPNLYVISAGP